MHPSALPLLIGLTALPPPSAPSSPDTTRCAVWQRELSFAAAVARHDAQAFADHVAPGAVFDATGPHPVRGRAAIATAWAPIVAGRGVHLRWYPTQVLLAEGVADTAYSSGPYLLEDPDPKAATRFRLGHFATVWRRGGDGTWRALFDGGEPGRPADAAAVAAFEAGRRTACPSPAR